MNRLKLHFSRYSFYVILGIIIVSTVVTVMSIHAAYNYRTIKNGKIADMHENSRLTVAALHKNVAGMMAAYAVNDYETLLRNEMDRRDNYAVIVEDYNMGKILGQESYRTGQIRDGAWNAIDFDSDNPEHVKALTEAYSSESHDILTPQGKKIGTITVYLSDRTLNEAFRQLIVDTLINTLVISVFLIVLLFITIRLFVLKPLSDIVATIDEGNAQGIPLKPVPGEGSREIFALADKMNRMINTIKDSQKALEHQATHDTLTGLANRTLFDDRLEQGILKAKRNRTRLALLFIDLDHFKEINDSMGHKVGDKALKIVTRRLEKTIREEDTLARLGGDEFTVILEGIHEPQDASVLAEKILKALSEPMTIENRVFYSGCSIGISLYPDNGDLPDDLLKYADAAMYNAKNEGRNTFQYYSTDMTERALERVVMETSLREGLKKGEIVVHYQPQVDGRNGTIVGMEALVRWQSPEYGLVSPAKFIPIAESSGLIVDLDRHVMKTAMIQIERWYAAGFNPGVMAMNLAAKQLQQKDFIDYLDKLIAETGCKPEWIELEVTESQIMIHPEEAIQILSRLSDIGVRLAVDDFGTGYSSLSYLKKFPINKIKIDRTFVQDLPHDEEDAAITKAIVALARNLNLSILAEGVETPEQQAFLIENGCAHIQGYLYSKPLPTDEMEALLSNTLG